MTPAVVLGFVTPGTKDFVWSPIFKVLGFPVNFITLLAILTVLTVVAFFYLALRKASPVPGRLQLVAEMGVDFIRQTVIMEVIGPDGLVYLPLFVTLFFFILFANLYEVSPLATTISSRFAFPLVMGVFIWFVYNGAGVWRHAHGKVTGIPLGVLRYLKAQTVPPGAPWLILILLVPVEFISNIVVRPISLALRLFLNFMAGHILLALVFAATVWVATAHSILVALTPLPFAVSMVMIGVEIFVAILQAFIFVVLSATYVQSAIAAEH